MERVFQGRVSGSCVEVGAFDGVTGGATLLFERLGWKCLLVEPNPEAALQATINRTSPVVACAAGGHAGEVDFISVDQSPQLSGASLSRRGQREAKKGQYTTRRIRVPMQTLDFMLDAHDFQPGIDFITIDVEGAEHGVLLGFNLKRWKPKILIVEDNGDPRVSARLGANNYTRFLRTGVNDWYTYYEYYNLVPLSLCWWIKRFSMAKTVREQVYWFTRPIADRVPQKTRDRIKRVIDRLIQPKVRGSSVSGGWR